MRLTLKNNNIILFQCRFKFFLLLIAFRGMLYYLTKTLETKKTNLEEDNECTYNVLTRLKIIQCVCMSPKSRVDRRHLDSDSLVTFTFKYI
jgi:hypothetical protein